MAKKITQTGVKPSRCRQIDISRAVKAAIAAGLTVTKIEVTASGAICVNVGGEQIKSTTPFDEWKAGK